MKAVILAAGDGGRLGMEIPKVLLKIGNEYILDYHIKGLKKIGIEEVVIITGFKSELIEAHITEHNLRNIINIKLVNNDKHDELENGYSVLCSKEAVDSSFLMMMGDHLVDYDSLAPLIKSEPSKFTAIIDSDPQHTSVEQATKVALENGLLKESSKKLETFDALDTGFFIVPPAVFAVLEENKEQGKTEWNDCVQRFIASGIKTFDIRSSFWLGINTPKELENAKRKLAYIPKVKMNYPYATVIK